MADIPIDLLALDRQSVSLCSQLLAQLVANGLLDQSERIAYKKLREALPTTVNLGARLDALRFALSVLTESGMGRSLDMRLAADALNFGRACEAVRLDHPEYFSSGEYTPSTPDGA